MLSQLKSSIKAIQTNHVPLPLHDMVAEFGRWRVLQSAAWFLHQQVHRLTADTHRGVGVVGG